MVLHSAGSEFLDEALRLPAGATAPAAARQFIRGLIGNLWQQEAIELLVSELVTNSVNYSDGPIELTVRQAGNQVRVEVSDTNPAKPIMREPSLEGQRGLHLVEAVAERWGVDRRTNGKTVWFELAAGSAVK